MVITMAVAVALGTAMSTAAAAPLAADDAAANPGYTVPTFQEFADSTFQDTDGQFIVNGDEVEESWGGLNQFYNSMVNPKPVKTDDTSLIVKTIKGGKDDRWSQSQVGNLTYCVSTAFGARHDDVVAAMAGGAGLWEGASSAIDYVHVPSQDGNCTTSNRSVTFSVEPVQTSQYIARAFFPSTRKRNILVDDSIWSSGSWTPTNIMGHELGHTLGFRHEHTRPESGTCFEDNNWRPLTAYDSASIMHYPQCNGSSSNLSMTQTDGQGAAALYGQ
ncbi:hypothetical protein N802_01995 [Knoellia sinensis KCTC 19936]|uniref:Peptidase metallopeptidase domain-containing protein n=2 Tax=Knoellia TaxID=136099 RepID=A0A0A0JCD5_9MICO|nr:hypothetical protein N802_01995 [Knoellia sinensis KCTC 19936]